MDEYWQTIGPWFNPDSDDDEVDLTNKANGQSIVSEGHATGVPQGRETETGSDLHATDDEPNKVIASNAEGRNEDTPQERLRTQYEAKDEDSGSPAESRRLSSIDHVAHVPNEDDLPSENDFFFRFPGSTERLPAEGAACLDPAPLPRPTTPGGWALKKRDIYLATRLSQTVDAIE